MKNSPLAFLAFVFSFALLVSQAIYGAAAITTIRPAGQSKVWGTVRFETENDGVSGINLIGVDTIIGRGLIVHADPDDLRTQPSGASGARIGCGVIGIAKP